MEWLQWAITTIVGILGILAGRYWERYDRRLKKDKEQIEKIVKLVPVDSGTLLFLRQHDFGDSYRMGEIDSLWELRRLLNQPSFFLIDTRLEKAKNELRQEINDFKNLITTEIFVSDRQPKSWELANPTDVIVHWVRVRKGQEKPMSDEEFALLEKETWNHYYDIRKKLNLLAENVCQKYDILISLAHRRL